MVELSLRFATLLLGLVACGVGLADANASAARYARHTLRTRHSSHGVNIEAFHPPGTFKSFRHGIDLPLEKRDFAEKRDVMKAHSEAFVASRLNIDPSKATFRTGYTADHGTSYVYLTQSHEGVPFANSASNIAIKNNKVIAFGHNFVNATNIAPSKPTFDIKSAISNAEKAFSATYNNQPITTEYLVLKDNTVALAYGIQLQNLNPSTPSFVRAYVDAHNGAILSVVDFIKRATFKALPVQKEYLTDGLELIKDPEDLTASPFGWLSTDGVTQSLETAGNNAIAGFDDVTQTVPASSGLPDITFNYTWDPTLEPDQGNNSQASRVNAFYIANVHHDVMYKYGFTESAYNFQENNFGKGGIDGDRVAVTVQSNLGFDNSFFSTAPDGQRSNCTLFLWHRTHPRRDGAMENDIVLHEMTHGVTDRMVGGGRADCLQLSSAAMLSEGWSDVIADWFNKNSSEVPDFYMIQYTRNRTDSYRKYPYSTNNVTNPWKFSDLGLDVEVHLGGEVWANVLHNVYAALVAEHGWAPDARTNPDAKGGNVIFMHHFIDHLPLLFCQPSILGARDAWIAADGDRYNGANFCLLWKAFASRGFGCDADFWTFADGFDIPDECKEATK